MTYEEKQEDVPHGPPRQEAGAPLTPHQEVKREVVELVKMVGLFLILFWGLKTFVIEGYEVQGPSMFPTLENGERILVFKLTYAVPLFGWLSPAGSGDIIVFESSVETNKRYVKRVIAKGPKATRSNTVDARHNEGPGPASQGVPVEFDKGKVYVNNHVIQEPYLSAVESASPDARKIYLGPGDYYVLGDHRSVSKDSRSFGAVHEEEIIGKAVLRFWPLSKFGLL